MSDFLNEKFYLFNTKYIIKESEIEYISHLGSGGSSDVYLGYYKGTEVAVKRLKFSKGKTEKILKEFEREVLSLILIRHSNIILFMGVIVEPNNLSVVYEFCNGGTLFDLLYGQLDVDISFKLRLNILKQIAKGMNFFHTNKPMIIHRDLMSAFLRI